MCKRVRVHREERSRIKTKSVSFPGSLRAEPGPRRMEADWEANYCTHRRTRTTTGEFFLRALIIPTSQVDGVRTRRSGKSLGLGGPVRRSENPAVPKAGACPVPFCRRSVAAFQSGHCRNH